jgi:hypothetical protein
MGVLLAAPGRTVSGPPVLLALGSLCWALLVAAAVAPPVPAKAFTCVVCEYLVGNSLSINCPYPSIPCRSTLRLTLEVLAVQPKYHSSFFPQLLHTWVWVAGLRRVRWSSAAQKWRVPQSGVWTGPGPARGTGPDRWLQSPTGGFNYWLGRWASHLR